MPVYTVTPPGGKSYDVTAPEGATEAQVLAYAKANYKKADPAPAPAPVARQPAKALAAAPKKRTLKDDIGGAVATLNRSLPGVSELGALMSSRVGVMGDLATGRSKVDFGGGADPNAQLKALNDAGWKRARDEQQGLVDGFMRAHPNIANLTTGAGYAVQAVPALLSGGATVAPAVSARAAVSAPGVRAGLARLGVRTLKAAPRNATIGGAYGAVNGASQPGDLSERVNAASEGAINGAVAGFAIPAGIDAGTSTIRHAVPIARRIAQATARAAGRPMANTLSGPETRAAEALRNAIARDEAAGDVIDPTRPLRLAGGENVAAVYDVLAKSPGPGRQMMLDQISKHADETATAIKGDLATSLDGKNDYFATQKAMEDARFKDANPHFEAGYAEPVGTENFDRIIDPILRRLPKGSMAKARDLQRMDGRAADEAGEAMVDSFSGTPIKQGSSTPEKVSARDLKSIQRGSKVGFGQGRSLLSFLNRAGGLRDEGRELSNMGLGAWHKGKPGHRQMIQENGLTLEDAAQRAHDAGYFPNAKGGDYHPVSPAEFLEAVRQEASGSPRFSREPDPKALARLGRLDELSGRLNDTPAKLDGLDKVSAGQALADHADELLRLEAHLDGPDIGMTPNVQARTVNPTLKTLHYVKMGLDQSLDKFKNKTTGEIDLTSPEAKAIDRVRADLVKSMRKLNPSYDKGMAIWGDDSTNLDALSMGRSVFSSEFTMQSENLGRLHGEMSGQAKAEFKKGVGEAILAEVRKPAGDIAAIKRLMSDKSGEFRDRIKLAFPDEASFERFVETMAARAKDADRDARYKGGSPTFGLKAARDDLEKQPSGLGKMLSEDFDFRPINAAGRAARSLLKMLPKGTPKSAIEDPTANAALARSGDDAAEVARLLGRLKAARRVSAAPKLQSRLSAPVGAVGGMQEGRR